MESTIQKTGETLAHVQSRSAIRLAQATRVLVEKDRAIRKLKSRLVSELAAIEQIESETMTPFVALFVKDGDRFKCLGVFNPDEDSEVPEDWLFCIPIPNPETMQEFPGF